MAESHADGMGIHAIKIYVSGILLVLAGLFLSPSILESSHISKPCGTKGIPDS